MTLRESSGLHLNRELSPQQYWGGKQQDFTDVERGAECQGTKTGKGMTYFLKSGAG